jgi:hypothetical protein
LRSGRFPDPKVDQRRRTQGLSKRPGRLTSPRRRATGKALTVAVRATTGTKRGKLWTNVRQATMESRQYCPSS